MKYCTGYNEILPLLPTIKVTVNFIIPEGQFALQAPMQQIQATVQIHAMNIPNI